MSGDIFNCHNWGTATGTWWVEAKDTVKHSATHRTAHTTKNYATHTVSNAKIEKPQQVFNVKN